MPNSNGDFTFNDVSIARVIRNIAQGDQPTLQQVLSSVIESYGKSIGRMMTIEGDLVIEDLHYDVNSVTMRIRVAPLKVSGVDDVYSNYMDTVKNWANVDYGVEERQEYVSEYFKNSVEKERKVLMSKYEETKEQNKETYAIWHKAMVGMIIAQVENLKFESQADKETVTKFLEGFKDVSA